MRDAGISFPEIARKFGIDHTTAQYHYRKWFGVRIPDAITVQFTTPVVPPPAKPATTELLPPAKLNQGKTYKEYLKELAEKENKPIKSYLPIGHFFKD